MACVFILCLVFGVLRVLAYMLAGLFRGQVTYREGILEHERKAPPAFQGRRFCTSKERYQRGLIRFGDDPMDPLSGHRFAIPCRAMGRVMRSMIPRGNSPTRFKTSVPSMNRQGHACMIPRGTAPLSGHRCALPCRATGQGIAQQCPERARRYKKYGDLG